MKRIITRMSALAIVICMIMVTFIPNTVFATGTGKAIQLVDSNNPTGGISDQDHIYFGIDTSSTDCFNACWRVLDADKTNTGASGMFLFAEELIGDLKTDYGGIHFNANTSKGNAWQDSDAQAWCNSFLSSNFSKPEKSAIMETTKSDDEYTYYFIHYYYDEEIPTQYTYKAYENILNKDKIFFLSAEEADSEAYGFKDNASRKKTFANNTYGYWWLRSSYAYMVNYGGRGDSDGSEAGHIISDGKISSTLVYEDIAARPAFNLDLSSVLFTSAAAGGKSSGSAGADALKEVSGYSGNDWKLTLKDSDRNAFSASFDSKDGDVFTIKYSNAKSGDNEYISAIIVDKDGIITYYGNLGKASSADDSTVTANLSGKYSKDNGDKLYVFNEQCNGDKKTDYSSELVEITPHTHDYQFKGFTWTGNDEDGYTKATAKYECSCGDSKTVEVENLVTETKEPTCDEEGFIEYTATVAKADSYDDSEHSETKTITLSKKTEGCQVTPDPKPDPKPVTPFPIPKTGIE